MSNTTFDRLCAILVKDYKLDPARLVPDARLEALGIDSLGAAELLFNIEDAFGIALPSDPVQLTTIGDVSRYIDDLVAARQDGGVAPEPQPPADSPGAAPKPSSLLS